MSSHKVHRRNPKRNNTKHSVGEKARQVLENINANSPIIKLFQTYATELDDKHDRYERVVKISRDITIESKRIIFLLHNAGTEIEEKKDHIFAEANLRLTQLLQKFKMIAYELQNLDHYLYLRAYTSGLQEYIEALYFYEYQRNTTLPGNNEISSKLIFTLNLANDETIEDLQLCCPIIEILLGLGLNLSGQSLISRKFYTLKQSLAKMELVCYNIKVRGSEIPKHMLATVVTSTPDENSDDDEGYY
ncbi:translin and translin associated protein x [Holotrichia oblita]|uniref:Translin and translin associated protein x n=2 Tax=Holotrichia oblita TaxID=644536 RepID=A0ACB9TQC1_HOLOL|nr:translin and translin associated protein x [Holotrichia oblita]KAI4468973.1 translin and translin associated protein x [Holotrichia oblita]